mmetsp:Transcript_3373/g.6612  ORF Transcript_3373/g.6612 Transcript_3373/m.6612 type:complete len:416 (-) Transcript_3373:556-1803(-)
MVNIAVVFFTKRGRLFTLAHEIAQGARETGATVSLYRVPGFDDEESDRFASAVQATPVITPSKLKDFDGIIFGAPCRQGRFASQMIDFLDNFAQDATLSSILEGKAVSAFTSTGGIQRGHGGHEHALQNMHSTFLQLGMVVCGLPPSKEMDRAELASPYGVTMGGGAGSGGRDLSDAETALARAQGRHTAEVARTLRPPVQLIYWNWKGRAEMTRLLLQAGGIPFEESNLRDLDEFESFASQFFRDMPDFQPLKQLSVAQLPILVDGTTVVSHSQAVARYVARKAGLYGSSFEEAALIDITFEAAEEIRTKFYHASFAVDKETRLNEFAKSSRVDFGRFEYDLKSAEAKGNGLYFVGGKLSLADVVVYSIMKSVRTTLPQSISRFQYLSRFITAMDDIFVAAKHKKGFVATPTKY